jgi:hypothetical protein
LYLINSIFDLKTNVYDILLKQNMTLQTQIIKTLQTTNVSQDQLNAISLILDINLNAHKAFLKDVQHNEFISDSESKLIDDEYDLLTSKEAVRGMQLPQTKPVKPKAKPVKPHAKQHDVLEGLSKTATLETHSFINLTLPRTDRKPNAWIEHLRAYKLQHPDMDHKHAFVNARTSYVPTGRASRKVAAKPKTTTKHACHVCDFKTGHKSNFNRHMSKHGDKKSALVDLMKARGLIRTLEVRAKVTTDDAKRAEYQTQLDAAILLRNSATKTLQMIQDGDIKPSKFKPKKVVTPKADIVKIQKSMIDSINKFYQDSQDEPLALTEAHIRTASKTDDDTWTMELTGFQLDDEDMDVLRMTPIDQGYDVDLLQNADIRGTMKLIPYIEFYVNY